MTTYNKTCETLRCQPQRWLITGVAGFIGSHLLETLLTLNQTVTGLDNFATGYQHNLDEVQQRVTPAQWSRFQFLEGDIRDCTACQAAVDNVDHVLHQAALGSVPRSIEDPINTNASNISGFLNMLVASRDANVKSFTYAASSSTYGDHPGLPKVEDQIGRPLSPYAVTKLVNELYAEVFARCYGFDSIGLRYFNVFGPRQDPEGAYAAVIPKWIACLLADQQVLINGDGETSRDFCYVDNAVQANILAALAPAAAKNSVYNVAVGDRTSLNELLKLINDSLNSLQLTATMCAPVYGDFRTGDVRHSQAQIEKISHSLGYAPQIPVAEGIHATCQWFAKSLLKTAPKNC